MPMKSALLLLLACLAPAQEETPKSPAAPLQVYVDKHSLAGAVALVATKDKILSVEAVGYMDMKAKTAMRPDALFWIASQSKSITATAVMMLVDEGKLSLDDPVEKHLPEFKGLMVIAEKDAQPQVLRKPVHPITVRNVLSHTSGMKFSSPQEKPTLDALTLKDAVLSYAMMPLQHEPDSKYMYSNAGINTAARILEVISGLKYEDFMQKRLFDPLGMKDTTFWPTDEQVARLAKGYKPNAAKDDLEETTISQLTYPLQDRKRQPMPAGGLFSTAADVARFCQMILNGGELDGKRVVSEAAVKELTKKQTAEALKDGYGLGFSTNNGNYGHGGAWATNMNIDSTRGLITVWMVQHSGYPGDGKNAQGAFKKAADKIYGSK
jgi:CubicO group peptidase (beta-lactamase class C family)